MERDVSLGFMWKTFKKAWWKIVIFALVAMLLVGMFTHFFIDKKYSSSIDFYIVNVNTSYDYTTTSLLAASSYLINDYVSIIKSDEMLLKVQEALTEKGYQSVSVSRLRSMISSSADAESSVFCLKLTDTNAQFAYDVAAVIAELAPTVVTDIAKPDSLSHESLADKIHTVLTYYNEHMVNEEEGEAIVNLSEKEIADMLHDGFIGIATRQNCITVLTPPTLDTVCDSPNLFSNCLLGGMIAALIVYLICLIRSLFECKIASEDDIKTMIDRPLIGTVPHWENSADIK